MWRYEPTPKPVTLNKYLLEQSGHCPTGIGQQLLQSSRLHVGHLLRGFNILFSPNVSFITLWQLSHVLGFIKMLPG